MINLSLRHLWIILVVGTLLSLAVFFRYELTPSGNGYNYYKLDRWTGTVIQCSPVKCANP